MWIPTTAWWSPARSGEALRAGAQRFIRQYQLEGKQTYGLLSCGLEGKSASKLLRAELEAAGTRCRSVITVKAENETLEALEREKLSF